MLRTRIFSALIGIPIVILLLFWGGIPWLTALAVAGLLAWREMDCLVGREHRAPDRVLGLLFLLAVLVEAYALTRGWISIDLLRPILTALLIVSLTLALYNRNPHPITDWNATIATALYLGILLSYFILLRERPNGFRWTTLAGSLTWLYDAAAYFTGSALGKHKLWPRISPRKTWEGLIGGTVATLVGGALAGPWLVNIPWWQGLALGALIAVADPFGDFAISLFKRQAHVKNTSQLIPGHGGLLDRLDSLLFTLPAAYYFALIIVGK